MLIKARQGKASIFVRVEREDHIRSAVDAFNKSGIQPVLVSAGEAHKVIDHIKGKIRGVVMTGNPVVTSNRGLVRVNRLARLQSAGIPVAFGSFAEEGSAGLIDVATMVAAEDWSQQGALRALTADAARMLALEDHVGCLKVGCGGDVLLLDGPPLAPSTRILNVWVNGVEVQP